MIWCTQAPVREMLNQYFAKRETVRRLASESMVPVSVLHQMGDELTSAVNELDVVAGFMKANVATNDQLKFRVALMALNIGTAVGTYVMSYVGLPPSLAASALSNATGLM